MSDKPLGPGWWLASDGTWHPPELHPSMREDASAAAPAVHAPAPAADTTPVPGMATMAGTVPTTTPPPVAETPADAPVATVEMPPLGPLSPRPVPSLTDVPKRPTWSGESDHRAEAGPMFPDLFQQAVAGTALANAITVNYADGEHRGSLDVPQSSSPAVDPQLVAAGGRMPAEVGAFTGASAKKRRWRL